MVKHNDKKENEEIEITEEAIEIEVVPEIKEPPKGDIPCPEGYPPDAWVAMKKPDQELYLSIIKQSKEIEDKNGR